MNRIEVHLDGQLAGWLTHDARTSRFGFDYAPAWLARDDRYALSPLIPLVPPIPTERRPSSSSPNPSAPV